MEYDGKENLAKNIKKATFHKAKNLKFSHVITKFVRIIKMIEKGDFNEIYRTIVRKRKRKSN